MSHRAVIIFPDDTARPVIDAIDAAQSSLRIKMFVFSAPFIIKAVIRAAGRGVNIRVMLNPARRNGQEDNIVARQLLEKAGIIVKYSNPGFAITHEKSMVIDDTLAFVQSLNWEEKHFTKTRDYAIVTRHLGEVQEITSCFEADWERKYFDSSENARLIWCNGNARARIARFIDDTRHTIFVQNERYQDSVILESLVCAARRGVKILATARPPYSLKDEKFTEALAGLHILKDAGIIVHELLHLKLHGKLLLADNSKAIVGSINFTPGSFEDRRELAIEVDDNEVIQRLKQTAHRDWENSRRLCLADDKPLQGVKRIGIDGSCN